MIKISHFAYQPMPKVLMVWVGLFEMTVGGRWALRIDQFRRRVNEHTPLLFRTINKVISTLWFEIFVDENIVPITI